MTEFKIEVRVLRENCGADLEARTHMCMETGRPPLHVKLCRDCTREAREDATSGILAAIQGLPLWGSQ